MRACANGKKEIATILYHWNSAAAKVKNTAGLTAAQLAGMSSCPEFREELEKLEQQKRQEQIEPQISSKHIRDSVERVIFVKPAQRQQQRGLALGPRHGPLPGLSAALPGADALCCSLYSVLLELAAALGPDEVLELPVGTRVHVLEACILASGVRRARIVLKGEAAPLGWLTLFEADGTPLVRPVHDETKP